MLPSKIAPNTAQTCEGCCHCLRTQRLCGCTPPPPIALKVRKTMVREVPVLRQGSAHHKKPKIAVGETTVRRVPVLKQGSACAREGRLAVPFGFNQ